MSFGKLIPLLPGTQSDLPDAQTIMHEYDKVVKTAKDSIVKTLTASNQSEAASFFGHLGKAYIFDIALIQEYLNKLSRKSNYITLVHACENNIPTMIFAAAFSDDSKKFFLTANSDGEVPEHPELHGTVSTAHGFDGGDTIVLTID
jgi:hypothetical protein